MWEVGIQAKYKDVWTIIKIGVRSSSLTEITYVALMYKMYPDGMHPSMPRIQWRFKLHHVNLGIS